MREIKYESVEVVRVDVFLSEELEDLSRSEIQRLIKNKDILVNGNKTKASYRLEQGDVITVKPIEEVDETIVPIDYPIEIMYEDDHLLVVNKPAHLVVYPGAGRETESVVAAVLGKGVALYEGDDKSRLGIVHRLDKDTSGLMVLSKSEEAHVALQAMFKERSIVRKYYALVDGNIEHDYGTIDAPIGRDEGNRTKMTVTSDGREAKTFFRVKEVYDGFTLVECELYSGRTHQIRVHMQYINHNIIGDPIYRKKTKVKSNELMLQSFLLEFEHPISGTLMNFELSLRQDFSDIINEWSK